MNRLSFNKSADVSAFRGLDFAAVDPGKWGALTGCMGGDYVLELPTRDVEQLHEKTLFGPSRWGVDVLVVESQYVAANARSAISLAEASGYVQGHLAAALKPRAIVSVYPASWQGPLGIKSRKQGADLLEEIYAYDDAPPWAQANKHLAEGWRSARAIGDWWQKVTQ